MRNTVATKRSHNFYVIASKRFFFVCASIPVSVSALLIVGKKVAMVFNFGASLAIIKSGCMQIIKIVGSC